MRRYPQIFFSDPIVSVFDAIPIVPRRIHIEHRVIRTVGIQIEPIAPVGVLLGEPGNDRVVESGTEIVLLGDWVKLLAGVLETVGDGLLLGRQVPPRVLLLAVLDLPGFVNDAGG